MDERGPGVVRPHLLNRLGGTHPAQIQGYRSMATWTVPLLEAVHTLVPGNRAW